MQNLLHWWIRLWGRGRMPRTHAYLGLIFSIFMPFLAKLLLTNRLAHPPLELTLSRMGAPSRKSCSGPTTGVTSRHINKTVSLLSIHLASG